jgi:hypothetical protein
MNRVFGENVPTCVINRLRVCHPFTHLKTSTEYNLRTELGSHFIYPNQHDSAGTEVDALCIGACRLSDSRVLGRRNKTKVKV